MKNITVIGSGTMGSGITHCFAQFGFQVTLMDISEEALGRAEQSIAKNFDRQIKRGRLTEEDKSESLARIATLTSLEKAVQHADLVIEAASENKAVKATLFKQMDAYAPKECVLATNTSSLSITELAAQTKRPSQVI